MRAETIFDAPLNERPICRRTVLAAGLAAPALWGVGGLTFGRVEAATIPDAAEIPFRVVRGNGRDIGFHRLSFDRQGDTVTVDIEIAIDIRIGFIPVFRYRHRNQERWRGDVLEALQSTTDDNGTAYEVRLEQDGAGRYRLTRNDEQSQITGPVLPTSYWRAETVGATQLLDTQRGVIREVTTRKAAEEVITVAGQPVRAHRYRMAGDLDLDLWYSQAGQWVKLAFSARGVDIAYALDGTLSANPSRPITSFVADLG